MSKKINCILLVDDNPDDNFFHERVIRKSGLTNMVLSKESGDEALAYLKDDQRSKASHPELIFLDINMPGMNGWEFLDEYDKLDRTQKSKVVVVMLTTSENPEDKAKAKSRNIIEDFKTKPLTIEMLNDIIDTYF